MKAELILHPDELNRRTIKKICEANVHILGIHPTGGESAESSLGALVDTLSKKEFTDLIDYATDMGLEIEYEFHAASYLLPRSLYDTHPEYFRMDSQGRRTPDYNFCPSSEQAMKIYADRAFELAKSLYKSRPYYYFWMDDKKDSFCQCPRCRKLSPSDQQLMVQNRVIRRLSGEMPEAKLAYLAYFECVTPPKWVKPENGIFLEYAPFEKYTAKGDDAPQLIENEKRSLSGLTELFGAENFKVLEYWYDNSMLSEWKKPPKQFTLKLDDMQRDISEYLSLGASQIASFACFLGDDYEELYPPVSFSDFSVILAQNIKTQA